MNPFNVLVYTPFLLQAVVISIDEFYFHHRRGLPRWEKIGHPLDTLSVLITYLFLLLSPFDGLHLGIYIALATFSCLLVTKDEFIHQSHCPPFEAWLHALLFILHPLSFVAAAFLWSQGPLSPFLSVQTALVGIFLLYQIIFWSPLWVQKK